MHPVRVPLRMREALFKDLAEDRRVDLRRREQRLGSLDHLVRLRLAARGKLAVQRHQLGRRGAGRRLVDLAHAHPGGFGLIFPVPVPPRYA